MTKLEKLLAEHERNAKRFVELRGKETLTEEELTEKRAIVDREKSLKAEIQEERDELALEDDYNASTNGGPPATETIGSGIVVQDKRIYRNFGEQLADIITIGKPGAEGKKDARERQRQSEKRMVEHGTVDVRMRRELEAEERAPGTGQVVGDGTLGGVFAETDFATDMIQKGFNNSAVLPKTQRRTLSGNSNAIEVFGIDEDSRKDGSRNGGVVVYTKAELEQYEESKAKFNGFEVKVNKLTGLLYLSDEILEDASFLEGEITSLFDAEFAFKTQTLCFDGSGAGEPLGINNAPALIAIPKDSGQTATTISTTNISNMKARAAGNAEFFGHKDIIPQLDGLTKGTGAAARALFKQTTINTGILDGIPITFVEQANTLGAQGDLTLADWGSYITATKAGLKKAESIHLKFEYGQKVLRWTLRFDGQPRWRSPLTPYNGTTTTSPFIQIAVRS